MWPLYGYVDIGSMGIAPFGSRAKDNSFLDFWKFLYFTDNGSQSGVFEVKHDFMCSFGDSGRDWLWLDRNCWQYQKLPA